jgi:hypothetical protein
MAAEDWQSRSRSTLAFAIAFSVIGLLITIGFAAVVIPRVARRAEMRMTAANGSIKVSPITSSPAMSPQVAPVAQSGETALESSSDPVSTSAVETTLLRTFALSAGSTFSIKNISGSISVEAWDQPKAEVRVLKRGPDRGAQVFFTSSANNLSLRTGVPGDNNSQDVRYEVKVPREMGRVDLKSVNGSVKLSDVTGQIFVENGNGSIELNEVVGVSKIQTANGKITATLKEASDGPMEFATANGKIDVTILSDFDAELDASTVHGSVDIDEQLGIPVQKEMVGQHARGRIGSGGQPLKLTAINGSIKLSKH